VNAHLILEASLEVEHLPVCRRGPVDDNQAFRRRVGCRCGSCASLTGAGDCLRQEGTGLRVDIDPHPVSSLSDLAVRSDQRERTTASTLAAGLGGGSASILRW